MALPTIEQLEDELRARVKTVETFTREGFSVFNLKDMESQVSGQQNSFPMFGVSYDGCEPRGKENVPVDRDSGAASLLNMQFVVVIAIQYSYTGQDDTKPQAQNLLDEVRAVVHGFKGINSRPWRFIGERPEPDASGDGVAFYSQLWQTTLPLVGNFNNS